jgi:CHAT domain-containing protein
LIGLVAVLAIGVTGALRRYLWTDDTVDGGNLGKLASVVGDHRLTRARLSGGFAYAPCRIDSSANRLVRGLVCDGPAPTSWKSAGRLRNLASDMRVRAQSDSASQDAHTAGIWDLIWGRTDDAVADLREAVKLDPLNASALNDLAVALTESAERHDDPSALIDAFVAADSAVRIDSTLKEARFTHALLLEQLYLRTDAIDAWNRYLKLDGKSRWADEAREHVTALKPRADQWKKNLERLQRAAATSDGKTIRSIVAEHAAETRMFIEEQFGAWSIAAIAADTAKAREHLDLARALAGPLRAATGDALMSDAVATIDRASAEKDSVRLRALAEGHVTLANGIRQFSELKYDSAKAELATAQKLLARGASPMTGWALLYQARAQTQKSPDSALKWLTAIRDSTPTHYLALRSLAAKFQGFVYDVRSDYMHLRAAYDSSLADDRTTQDPQVTLRLGSWLAQVEGVLRGREAAWRAQYAALAASPRHPASYLALISTFDYAGLTTANGAPRLSLRYFDEAIRIARQLPASNTVAYGLRHRAELLATMGETDRASADMAAALNAAHRVADTAARTMLLADVTLTSAHIALRSAPSEAENSLRRVVDQFKAVKNDKGLSSAYLYLAQSRASLGAIESARVAFDSAMNLMQRQRATVQDYAERGSFLDAARAVIDQIVAFRASRSGRDAFEYFEGTRSRVLLEQVAQSRGQSADQPHRVLAQLQRRLTKDDVVLSYAVLPRELLIWIVGHNRFEQHRVSVTAPELEGLVNQFQRSVLDASGEPDTGVSERLYRILVDSAARLEHGENLIVIPDRWLHFVPFVALRDPSTGRYLVREHAVSYAPSATLLLSRIARAHERFYRSSRVLAIGNPAFDRGAFQLPYLPAAEGEARRIAALYANQTPLIGRDATDMALERMAPNVDILHFAGHAVVGRDAPQLSHLVLASDGRSGGAVFSTEIARWKLTRTRLVILSGCNTADGKLSATEGASSLARAFFAAGVPAVLASLWAIDDDDTADFFVAFHRRLSQGDPTSAALRKTQIEWLGDGRTPAHPVRSWAAFQLFGG